MIEMAQFYNIKFLKEVEGLSQRKIATKLGSTRNTVSKYLNKNAALSTVLRKEYIEQKNTHQKQIELSQLSISGWKMIKNMGKSKNILRSRYTQN
jgi:predicted transcriptional regulator